jgi:hypothetical protein
MDIAIPDTVTLYTQEFRSGGWKWGHYCFAHAVLRALEGEQIKMKLESESMRCDDCDIFGSPNTHDLSIRLRRLSS